MRRVSLTSGLFAFCLAPTEPLGSTLSHWLQGGEGWGLGDRGVTNAQRLVLLWHAGNGTTPLPPCPADVCCAANFCGGKRVGTNGTQNTRYPTPVYPFRTGLFSGSFRGPINGLAHTDPSEMCSVRERQGEREKAAAGLGFQKGLDNLHPSINRTSHSVQRTYKNDASKLNIERNLIRKGRSSHLLKEQYRLSTCTEHLKPYVYVWLQKRLLALWWMRSGAPELEKSR